MANLTKIKREKMLAYLEQLKAINNYDANTIAITEIENALNEKKYGLVWEEHSEKVDERLEDNIPVFVEDESRKIVANEEEEYNFLLEGDNLHSLKLLEKTHKGKIDVIYIDPPYNRGKNDFIYNDDYVDKTDGYMHSKWLSFMHERLLVAKKLLSESGVIFISIDENEVSQQKLLCDDVFGNQSYLTTFIRKTKSMTGDDGNGLNIQHEYLHVYAKNKIKAYFIGDDKKMDSYSNLDNDPNGDWTSGDPSAKSGGESTYFPIENPHTGQIDFPPEGRYWAFSKETMKKYLNSGRIKFKNEIIKNQRGFIFKRYAEKLHTQHMPVGTLEFTENCFMNSVATKELADILKKVNFDYPKPILFIKKLIKFTSNNNSIILDFFAGSGTTGQAVLELNKEDGGKRKFILCTDNKNNICEEVTYERIKKVIQGYEFMGKKDTILYEKKITAKDFKNIKSIETIISEEKEIKQTNKGKYDKIKTTFCDCVYRVIGEKKYQDKMCGIDANLKYYKTEFIPKFDAQESISDSMLEHIKELIELEHHIEIDDKKYIILDDEDEIDSVLDRVETGGKIFVTSGIFLSRSEQRIIEEKAVSLIEIPEYYFREELMELGAL